MSFNQRDIVLLPYPYSNLKGKKVRPALIVSNDNFNIKSADCLMVPLTTMITEEHNILNVNNGNLQSGKLPQLSRIRVDKIFAVEKKLIIMKIGTLNLKTFEKVKKELFKVF